MKTTCRNCKNICKWMDIDAVIKCACFVPKRRKRRRKKAGGRKICSDQCAVGSGQKKTEHCPPTTDHSLPPQSTSERIADMCDRLKETLQRKNHDYGDSAFKSPLLCPTMDAGSAIRVRMSDKINRLITMELCDDIAERVSFAMMKQTESLFDTYLDLAGYAVLRLIELEKTVSSCQ